MNMRIGHGYDVHRLVEGRHCIIGGVDIPFELGLDGHSDADVLTHAVMDALLGALALGDIGRFFPDTDPAYKDADSLKLLGAVMRDPRLADWRIGNIDLTIVAQKPKLLDYNLAMRTNLERVLTVPLDRVSVKATTTEKLGFEGREEGISAMCVALLER